MGRLTYRDKTGRPRLTIFGYRMYCSTQATADCICRLEEALEELTVPKVMTVQEVKQLKRGALVAYECKGLEFGEDGKHHTKIVCHAAEFETIDSRGVVWFHCGIGIEGLKNYGKTFRIWTSRPEDKRRADTPWS